jgi:hypothetical protein
VGAEFKTAGNVKGVAMSKVSDTINTVQKAYEQAIEAELTALRGIQFPPEAQRDSPLEQDNFLVQLLPKYYLEDFHTTTLVYLLRYGPTGDAETKPFLQLFLELLVQLQPELTGLETRSADFTVEQEARSDGWIDILLINHTNGSAIIVENKIHAGDQDRQIPRYFCEVTNRPFDKGRRYRVEATVYLTLNGRDPSYFGWTEDDKERVKPICIAYAGGASSVKDSVLDAGAAMPGCEPVKSIVEWYVQIIKDLSGRSENMEILQDFARNVVDDEKAMATIADVINHKEDIEAALCQELGDRIFAQLKKTPNWSVSRSKYPEGQEIRIECKSDRWDYAVWTEGRDLTHGFVVKGKPFTKKEKADLAKKFPRKPQEYEGTYFSIALTVDLSDRNLADQFSEAGVGRLISDIEATIG